MKPPSTCIWTPSKTVCGFGTLSVIRLLLPVAARGHAEIQLGSFKWESIAGDYLIPIPERTLSEATGEEDGPRVFRRADEIVVRPFGFLLWTTKEQVGTPKIDPRDGPDTIKTRRHPELMCFVNAKSTRARTGILVHFTAPTIHAGWAGKITLEITNLGPFDFVLRENDAIAQLTVATISSASRFDLAPERAADSGTNQSFRQVGEKAQTNTSQESSLIDHINGSSYFCREQYELTPIFP